MTARLRDPRIAAGTAVLAAIGVLVGGAFAGLAAQGGGAAALAGIDAYVWRVARFTLWQAALSTVLAVGPGLLVARALSRHPDFFGRRWLLRLFAVPLGLPAIVAALGLLAFYGRAGYLADLAGAAGAPWPGIYGLAGILLAHVFFNMPLGARLFLEALDAIPADQWRLASQLGMGSGAVFRLIEWPALRAALPAVAGLVFMLCVTSFTLVLTLGGGPAATTLEVAIYQSLRFDFDPARASLLTLLQVTLTVAVVAVLARLGADLTGEAALAVSRRRYLAAGRLEVALNALLLLAAGLFVLLPLGAIAASGLEAELGRLLSERTVWRALATSLALSAAAALLAVAMSLALARMDLALGRHRPPGAARMAARVAEAAPSLVLVVPPVVLGAGWFMLLRRHVDVFAAAPAMVVAVNAAMAMPFAIRAIRPAHDDAAERHDRLCAQLGLAGWNRFRLIDWPVLRRPLATAFAFAMALSLGDLGVIALFGSDAVQTLPYLLFQRMGSYRTADAAGIALLLGLLCLALMIAGDLFARERT